MGQFLARAGICSTVGVPLKLGDRAIAVLLLHLKTRQRFDDADQQIIEAYATYLALCLEIGRLARESRESGAREHAQAVARELHDAVLHMLTAHVVPRLGSAKDLIRAGKCTAAEHELTVAERATAFCADECRSIMGILAKHIVHDLGLVSSLRELQLVLHGASKLGLQLPSADGPLPLPLKLHLFRIAEQAVMNALSHAQARQITVQLELASDVVTLTVADDGKGFDLKTATSAEGKYGLRGIRDRVEKGLGGAATIESEPGRGTKIIVKIPIGEKHAGSLVTEPAAAKAD